MTNAMFVLGVGGEPGETRAEGQWRIVMKRVSLLVVALLGLLVAAPAVQAAPPTSAFTGHWEAVDPFDGSNLEAIFFGGSSAGIQILYTDDGAPGTCGDESNQFFTSFLTARIDGNELSSTMRWARCGTVNLHFAGFEITWTLDDQGDADPSNDVVTNSFGEIFSRAS